MQIIIFMIVAVISVFSMVLFYSNTVNTEHTPSSHGSSPSKPTSSLQRNSHRTAHVDSQTLIDAKHKFLTNNSHFFDLFVSSILCSQNPELSWILEKETSEQYEVRTVFLGYNDIYFFIGTPLEPAFRTDNNFPWPNTFWVMNGGQTVTHYKYQRFTYADHLGFAPISDYQGIARKIVLGWIAEEIRSRFLSPHKNMKISDVRCSIQEQDCYYYFTYNAAEKSLSGWQ